MDRQYLVMISRQNPKMAGGVEQLLFFISPAQYYHQDTSFLSRGHSCERLFGARAAPGFFSSPRVMDQNLGRLSPLFNVS